MSGAGHAHYSEAVDNIWTCPDRIELFDELWANATPEFAWRLFDMTKSVRDLRAYNVVNAVAADVSRPAVVRVAAMGVLAAWINDGLSVNISGLEPDTTLGTFQIRP